MPIGNVQRAIDLLFWKTEGNLESRNFAPVFPSITSESLHLAALERVDMSGVVKMGVAFDEAAPCFTGEKRKSLATGQARVNRRLKGCCCFLTLCI